MLYIYRLANGSKSPRGLAAGLNGVVPITHPRMAAYVQKHGLKQSLYLPVGEGRAELTSGTDVHSTRDYSPMFNAVPLIVRRLLTIRTEWSKK